MKITRQIFLAIFFILNFQSCNTDREKGPEQAGREYCECMRLNGSPENFQMASIVCESVIVAKYYYYRLEKIDIPMQNKSSTKLSESAQDSAYSFFLDFEKYLRNNCCKEVLNCNLRSPFDSMSIDSFYKIRNLYPDSDFSSNRY